MYISWKWVVELESLAFFKWMKIMGAAIRIAYYRNLPEGWYLQKLERQQPPHSFCLFFLINLFIWDRVRWSMNGGGSERQGDTESVTGSRLRAVGTEPDTGLELTDREIMTWAQVGCLTDWATQVPPFSLFRLRRLLCSDNNSICPCIRN